MFDGILGNLFDLNDNGGRYDDFFDAVKDAL